MLTGIRLWTTGLSILLVSGAASAQTSYNRWEAKPPAPIVPPKRATVKTEAKPTVKTEIGTSDPLAELASPRTTTEQMPVFPGGYDAFMNYLKSYLKRLKEARPSGTMYITYTVLSSGATSNVRVAPGRGLSPSFDAAVVEAISGISNFSPGKRNGQTADMEVTMPISFD